MDYIAFALALLAAFAFSPWASARFRIWGVSLLILAVVAQWTVLTGHTIHAPFGN
jgi:hypothetical protein